MTAPGPTTIAQAHLKRATRALVDAVGGGQRGAGLCRVRQQDLSDYGNRDVAARFMPADVIADLEAVAGHPFVTEALASEAGCAIFKLPNASLPGADWPVLLSRFAKEGGEVMGQIAIHAADGISAAEVRKCNLIGEIDEAIAILVNMRAAACAAISEG